MDIVLDNIINNDLEIKQNNFLQSKFGKAINNGINVGLRFILPDWAENSVIELKDNLLKFGLKEGISKTIQDVIETGKSAAGIVSGNFDNINQINEAVKNGGIIDSVSGLFDSVLFRMRNAGKINDNTFNIIKNGKEAILDNVEKNIENTWNMQMDSSRKIEKYISDWKSYYNKQDFNGMEKEYGKIRNELKNLVPIENTINNARSIQSLHKLIKKNGQNFNLTQEEVELANKLSL